MSVEHQRISRSVLRCRRKGGGMFPRPPTAVIERSNWVVAPRRRAWACGAGAASLVLNLHLGLPHSIGDSLGPLLSGLANHDLLLDPRFLGDHRLLADLSGLDRLVAEHVFGRTHRAVHWATLDLHALLVQRHLLLHGCLHHVAADANPTMRSLPLADP